MRPQTALLIVLGVCALAATAQGFAVGNTRRTRKPRQSGKGNNNMSAKMAKAMGKTCQGASYSSGKAALSACRASKCSGVFSSKCSISANTGTYIVCAGAADTWTQGDAADCVLSPSTKRNGKPTRSMNSTLANSKMTKAMGKTCQGASYSSGKAALSACRASKCSGVFSSKCSISANTGTYIVCAGAADTWTQGDAADCVLSPRSRQGGKGGAPSGH